MLYKKLSLVKFGNILDREIYPVRDSALIGKINAMTLSFIDMLISAFRRIRDMVDRDKVMVLAVFSVIPCLLGLAYYICPSLYDHLLLSRGSRLLYVEVVKMMLYELDKRLIWVRSGVSTGVVIAFIVMIIKGIIDNTKKGTDPYGKQ